MDVAVLDGGTLVAGRDFLMWDGGILRASEVGCDRFYRPTTSPDGRTVAVWAGSDNLNRVVLVDGNGVEIMGPYERAGLPCWDHQGNLWFTAEGSLLRNGEMSGHSLGVHHISVAPGADRLVFTDRQDRLLVMDMASGNVDTLSTEYRFFGPFFVGDDIIVSPSLNGGIWMFKGTDAVYVDHGEQPAWWRERNSLVYIRTTDDGMNLTSSDIWTWTCEQGSRRLTDTPYILEINPTPAPDGVYFVDSFSGMLGFVEVPR
jgi:hypothetical protein